MSRRALTKNEKKWVAMEVYRMRGIYLNYREKNEMGLFLSGLEIMRLQKYKLSRLSKRIVACYVHPDRTIVP